MLSGLCTCGVTCRDTGVPRLKVLLLLLLLQWRIALSGNPLRQVEKIGGYKYPQYAGPAFITRLGGSKGSRLRRALHIHVGPEWSLRLHGIRTCVEAAPGVVLLSGDNHSDPEGTFFLIAVGTAESDQSCVAGLESLLKETCTYLVSSDDEAL